MINELNDYLAGKYNGIDCRLKEVSFSWDTKGLPIEGRFYYLAFNYTQ